MIDLSHVSDIDLFGKVILKIPGQPRFSGYYRSLDAIRPMFHSEDWLGSVTGFYINIAGGFNSVRLSYFTASPNLTQMTVERFAKEFRLEFEVAELPHHHIISRKYGNEEIRFRRFLSIYTQIGLEIMEKDLLHARCLFATFRWQIMRARKSYRPHFLRTFESQSAFYNSLGIEQQDQFWCDLAYWPNPPQVDWAHLFVNMVLGCDWNGRKAWLSFLSPQPPLSIPKINEIVAELGFQVPNGWQP